MEHQGFPTAPPPKVWRSAFDWPPSPPCNPATGFPSHCRGLGLGWASSAHARPATRESTCWWICMRRPPPTRAAGETALRLRPAKACGLAAKIVRRGSRTCLFWNLAGLSEITKPDRQRRLRQSGGPCSFPFLRDRPGGSRTVPLGRGPPPVPFQGAGIMAVLTSLRPLDNTSPPVTWPSPATDPTPEMVGRVPRVFLSPTLFLCSDPSLSLSFSLFSFFSPGSQSLSGGLSAPCLWTTALRFSLDPSQIKRPLTHV